VVAASDAVLGKPLGMKEAGNYYQHLSYLYDYNFLHLLAIPKFTEGGKYLGMMSDGEGWGFYSECMAFSPYAFLSAIGFSFPELGKVVSKLASYCEMSGSDFVRLTSHYLDYLYSSYFLSFNDCIFVPFCHMLQHPGKLAEVQAKYTYFLQDESQDQNPSHAGLLFLADAEASATLRGLPVKVSEGVDFSLDLGLKQEEQEVALEE
jgi:hypothetical protein